MPPAVNDTQTSSWTSSGTLPALPNQTSACSTGVAAREQLIVLEIAVAVVQQTLRLRAPGPPDVRRPASTMTSRRPSRTAEAVSP